MSARLRWVTCGVLLVLTVVLAAAGLLARYANGHLLETERYVALVGPLARDEVVQAQVVDVVTDGVMARLDVETATASALAGLAGLVDPDAAPRVAERVTVRAEDAAVVLAPVVAREVEGFVRSAVERIVTSPRFADLWQAAHRQGHRVVVAVVTGEGDVLRAGADGTVEIALGPVVDLVRDDLTGRGFSLAERIPDLDPRIAVGRFPQIEAAQRGVALLDRVATWLPWVVLALGALTVWAAPSGARRRAVALVGGAWAGGALLVGVGLVIGRRAYLDALPPGMQEGATGAVLDTLVAPLRGAALWLLVLGWAVALAAIVWPLVRPHLPGPFADVAGPRAPSTAPAGARPAE